MHLRRALLLFALVLGLTALATSIAPTQRSTPNEQAPAAPPLPPIASGGPVTVGFTAIPNGKPPTRKVRNGVHVIVQVSSTEAGDVSMPALGRVAPVTADTPAIFDLIAPPPGRYSIVFKPAAGGAAKPSGTLVTTA